MTATAVETSGGERIEQLVSTVRTKAWLAAVALVVVAGSGAGWAWLGQVRDVVLASGVLVAGGGPAPVAAPVAGSLAEVLVSAGQEVAPGTSLAVLAGADGTRRVVVAASAGRVIRTAVPGAALAAGAPVAVVDPAAGPLKAVLLVGPERVGALTAGQPVTVTGAGPGRVSAVGPYPVSTDQLRPVYGDALTADGRYLVTVDLDRPAWPGATLTPVAGEITVATVRPVDALFHGGSRG
ncbi:HlyD family efflux transporter periplasmic adaptor subunit [Herbidospora daliensis]|uniref:HlyD family efflux transporter periplasmic adaptor subunit n=1 Tax=Herbidospora daliensis TaxID=295585 RepID=UPI000786323D|nr:HlyD family efflux transporter periplasmic adaptor subunit [Herbidospora daliensis]